MFTFVALVNTARLRVFSDIDVGHVLFPIYEASTSVDCGMDGIDHLRRGSGLWVECLFLKIKLSPYFALENWNVKK